MTDKLRAAARAALDALLESDPLGRAGTIEQLRAALAEPEPCWCDRQQIGEPEVSCGDCPTRDYQLRGSTKMIGEPVAWAHNLIADNIIRHCPADIGRHPDRWTPLYTEPPRREWVGLTDEETRCLGDKLFGFYPGPDGPIVQLARAIEAALKEKNA